MKETIATKRDFDLRWFSGSGAGGQHRNKHQNCLELTHRPSGMKETRQGRSRQQNLKSAFKALARRVVERHLADNARDEVLRETEIVRTYNVVDNRVKDHESGRKILFSELDSRFGELVEARADAKLMR